MSMKITIAKNIGFCFGVKNALDKVKNIKNNNGVYVLGQLIHNPQAIKQLEKNGIKTIETVDGVKKGTVIISAHGVPDSTVEMAKKKGLKVIDTTCPLVKNVHRITKNLEKNGCKVIIFGDKEHTEVKGIVGNLKNAVVTSNVDSLLKDTNNKEKIGIVFQTTQDADICKKIISLLKNKKNVIIKDTICSATKLRQLSAKGLARKVDLMLVIGGYNSGNTKRLNKICSEITEARHVETDKDLKRGWLKNKNHIGITAGASTPDWVIEGVIRKLKNGF